MLSWHECIYHHQFNVDLHNTWFILYFLRVLTHPRMDPSFDFLWTLLLFFLVFFIAIAYGYWLCYKIHENEPTQRRQSPRRVVGHSNQLNGNLPIALEMKYNNNVHKSSFRRMLAAFRQEPEISNDSDTTSTKKDLIATVGIWTALIHFTYQNVIIVT